MALSILQAPRRQRIRWLVRFIKLPAHPTKTAARHRLQTNLLMQAVLCRQPFRWKWRKSWRGSFVSSNFRVERRSREQARRGSLQ